MEQAISLHFVGPFQLRTHSYDPLAMETTITPETWRILNADPELPDAEGQLEVGLAQQGSNRVDRPTVQDWRRSHARQAQGTRDAGDIRVTCRHRTK